MNPSIAIAAVPRRTGKERGFTLVEMAIGILVIALLLGSILVPLSTQVEQRKISETQKALDEIREALLGFALTQGYLPCPAVSATNGAEGSRTNGVCDNRMGFVPWGALGSPKLDAWGRIFLYSVTPAFSNAPPAARFSLGTGRDITIETRDNAGTLINLSVNSNIPAVILSVGRNGHWGTIDDGTTTGDASGTNIDEDANQDGNGSGRDFIVRTQTDNSGAAGGEFDDIVAWLSPNVLFNRMVAAGQLPR
jgi:prepilin-type N-terminal cleavage/methylation domain-containing protein